MIIALFLLSTSLYLAVSLDNGLGRTPAMGWNSWNKFACNIDETLIRGTADALVDSGLAKAGYVYLNLDDCWQLSRDKKTKEIQADPKTFPSGMKALGDYIHSKGLKYGLYSSAGTMTCQRRPGGLFFEDIDARTYASWGVDYLKYDNCYNLKLPSKFRYTRMRDALNKTGRPIYYSLCQWGEEKVWEWGAEVANSWRTTGDIENKWESVMNLLKQSVPISLFGAQYGWNDPDMLEVGNGGMTVTEEESHFALWAYMKSPLIIGCDVTNMSKDTFRILTNPEVIAVNQDPLGRPASRLWEKDGLQVWGGPLDDGYAALFFNAGDSTAVIGADFSLFELEGKQNVRDISKHVELGVFEGHYEASVVSHGVHLIKLTPKTDNVKVTEESSSDSDGCLITA